MSNHQKKGQLTNKKNKVYHRDKIENKMKVSLIQITPDPEKHIGYIARVSNPTNQNNPNVEVNPILH